MTANSSHVIHNLVKYAATPLTLCGTKQISLCIWEKKKLLILFNLSVRFNQTRKTLVEWAHQISGNRVHNPCKHHKITFSPKIMHVWLKQIFGTKTIRKKPVCS